MDQVRREARGYRDREASQASQVSLERTGWPVHTGKMVHQERKAFRVTQDLQDNPVFQDPGAHLVCQAAMEYLE